MDDCGRRRAIIGAASAVIDDSVSEAVALMRSLGVPKALLEARMREIIADKHKRAKDE